MLKTTIGLCILARLSQTLIPLGMAFALLLFSANDLRSREFVSVGQLADILQHDPNNRHARWALARSAFGAGQFDVARYHVERLLRTARSQNDLDVLSQALAKITQVDPWSVSLNFSLLPSTNLRRTTYNTEFITNLGVFTPTRGGQEDSGIGFSAGGSLSYALSLTDRTQLTLKARLDQNFYDVSDLNQTNIGLAASQEIFFVGGSAVVEPFARFRFDNLQGIERRDIGLFASRNWFLEGGDQIIGSVTLGNRHYFENDYLSGPHWNVRLRYNHLLGEQTKVGLGISLARSEPDDNHLRYSEERVSVDISRSISKVGNVGVFGSFATRGYDSVFPATNLVRNDETVVYGVSFSPRNIRVFGSYPRLSCQNQRNFSNIALYDYETTDCSLTFDRSF